MSFFDAPDFDAHEGVHFFDDAETGMRYGGSDPRSDGAAVGY